jgi:hypothetical protein
MTKTVRYNALEIAPSSEIHIADAFSFFQWGMVYQFMLNATPVDTFKVGILSGPSVSELVHNNIFIGFWRCLFEPGVPLLKYNYSGNAINFSTVLLTSMAISVYSFDSSGEGMKKSSGYLIDTPNSVRLLRSRLKDSLSIF